MITELTELGKMLLGDLVQETYEARKQRTEAELIRQEVTIRVYSPVERLSFDYVPVYVRGRK